MDRIISEDMRARCAQQDMARSALAALARRSPAAVNLAAQTSALRRVNVLRGLYVPDDLPANDGAYRVALTDAGERVLAHESALQALRARLPADQRRGFTMAMGVRAGRVDPGFSDFVRDAIYRDRALMDGFDTGMASSPFAVVPSSTPPLSIPPYNPPMPVLPAVGGRITNERTEIMAVDRETLIRRLETICAGACAGDTEAIAKVSQIKAAAQAGDARAKLALGALRHLYFRKQADTASWNMAEAIYRETAKDSPQAKLAVKGIIAHARAGDPVAVATWGRLKAIHASTKPGALFPPGPGQAKMGGYGLPVLHRAGFRAGGTSLVGAYAMPVRNAAGLVVGRRPILVGGQMTEAQKADLRTLMEAAARARVFVMTTRGTTTLGPSAVQQASVSTFRTRAVRQGIATSDISRSRYGSAYVEPAPGVVLSEA
jgi:hypothetical protein